MSNVEKLPLTAESTFILRVPCNIRRKGSAEEEALELAGQGLTLSQIAKEIGVSIKTVQRDLSKLERYVKGQINRRRYLLDQEHRRELESLSATSFLERSKMLSRLLFHTRKLGRKEEYKQHNKTIFLDLDNLSVDGFPRLVTKSVSSTFKTPYNMTFIAVKQGQHHLLGNLRIG